MPYLGKSPSQGVRTRYLYTATANQTTFSGTDTQNLTLTYSDSNFIDVHQNGVLLKVVDDYTATSGTSVVLGTGATADDVVEIIVYDVFAVGNFFNRTDSDSRYVNVDGTTAVTITTTDNNPQLTLKTTDADANDGPLLSLSRDSSSPADGDLTGRINFNADNDAGEVTAFSSIRTFIRDASDGTEDGGMQLNHMFGGSEVTAFEIDNDEYVINQGSNDIDFRVESNGQTHALFVDAGNDHVNINTSTDLGSTLNVNGEISVVNADAGLLLVENAADANGSNFTLRKSRNATLLGHTVVQSGDSLGNINFQGSDGTDYHSGASISAAVDTTPGNNDMPGRLAFFTTADGDSSPTERFRINNAGSIFIGNNASGAVTPSASQTGTAFAVGNFPYILNSVNDASTRYHHQFFNSNGSVGIISTNGSNTTYATSSDYRLKENVNYTWDGTTELKKLKPCKFNFKTDNTETLQGFLAHEVAEVVPNAVVGNKDEMRVLSYYEDEETLPAGKKIGDVKERSDTEIAVQSLDSSHLVPLLTKALQESIARADALEARIKKLEDG